MKKWLWIISFTLVLSSMAIIATMHIPFISKCSFLLFLPVEWALLENCGGEK